MSSTVAMRGLYLIITNTCTSPSTWYCSSGPLWRCCFVVCGRRKGNSKYSTRISIWKGPSKIYGIMEIAKNTMCRTYVSARYLFVKVVAVSSIDLAISGTLNTLSNAIYQTFLLHLVDITKIVFTLYWLWAFLNESTGRVFICHVRQIVGSK